MNIRVQYNAIVDAVLQTYCNKPSHTFKSSYLAELLAIPEPEIINATNELCQNITESNSNILVAEKADSGRWYILRINRDKCSSFLKKGGFQQISKSLLIQLLEMTILCEQKHGMISFYNALQPFNLDTDIKINQDYFHKLRTSIAEYGKNQGFFTETSNGQFILTNKGLALKEAGSLESYNQLKTLNEMSFILNFPIIENKIEQNNYQNGLFNLNRNQSKNIDESFQANTKAQEKGKKNWIKIFDWLLSIIKLISTLITIIF